MTKKTFKELCLEYTKTTLYRNQYSNIIIEMNRLGFLSYTSQCGFIDNFSDYINSGYTRLYKSTWHRLNKITGLEDLDIKNYSRRQRAYIRGFMKKDMAEYITNYFSLHFSGRLYANYDGNINNFYFPDECKFGSEIFFNEKPVLNEFPDIGEDDIEELKKLPDFDGSYDLSRSTFPHLIDIFPDIIMTGNDEVVGFHAFDVLFNNNDLLWESLLNIIKDFNNNKN